MLKCKNRGRVLRNSMKLSRSELKSLFWWLCNNVVLRSRNWKGGREEEDDAVGPGRDLGLVNVGPIDRSGLVGPSEAASS